MPLAQAKITVNGSPGSDTDVPVGGTVQLNNQNLGGETTYAWVFDDQPPGPADTFSNPSIQNPVFTSSKEGSYKISLIVNMGTATESRDTVIVAVRQVKTRIRIPAAGEQTQADTQRGWSTDMGAILQLVDSIRSDPGLCVVQLGAGTFAEDDVVAFTDVATIMSGLPGEQEIPVATLADATTAAHVSQSLGMIVEAVDLTLTTGDLALVRRFGMQTINLTASPGDYVFLSDTPGGVDTTPGTKRRMVGHVLSSTAGISVIEYDGSNFDSDASGGGAAGGDLSGTYPNPIVKQLTGLAGIVGVLAALQLDAGSGTFPTIGQIRAKQDTTIISTHSNGADRGLISANAFGDLVLGAQYNDTNGVATVQQVALTAFAMFQPGVSTMWYWTNSDYTMQMYYVGASPTLKHRGQASDTATFDFVVSAQAPFASATGSNRKPGDFVIDVPIPTNSGTAEGAFKLRRNSLSLMVAKAFDGSPTYSGIWFQGTEGTPSAYAFLGNSTETFFSAPGGSLHFSISDSERMLMTGSSLTMKTSAAVPVFQFDFSTTAVQHFRSGATSAKIKYDDQTSDTAPLDIVLEAQGPVGTATGTNRHPGHIVVNIPAHATNPSAPHHGGFDVAFDGTKIVRIGEYADSTTTYGAIWFGSAAASPTTANYAFLGAGTQTYFNAQVEQIFSIGGSLYPMDITSSVVSIGNGNYTQWNYQFDCSDTAVFRFNERDTSATIKYADRTSDNPTRKLSIIGEGASAGSTGTNQVGGNLGIYSGANKSGYTGAFPGVEIGMDGSIFAASGTIRVAKDFSLSARNNGNSGDIPILEIVADNVYFGDQTAGNAVAYLPATNSFEIFMTGTLRLQADNYVGFASPVGGVDAGTNVSASPFIWNGNTIDVTSVGSANVTATAAQYSCVILKATGSPAATRNVILPDDQGAFFIVHNASGQTVNWRKSGGTGVSTGNGQTAAIYHDGSDYTQIALPFP